MLNVLRLHIKKLARKSTATEVQLLGSQLRRSRRPDTEYSTAALLFVSASISAQFCNFSFAKVFSCKMLGFIKTYQFKLIKYPVGIFILETTYPVSISINQSKGVKIMFSMLKHNLAIQSPNFIHISSLNYEIYLSELFL